MKSPNRFEQFGGESVNPVYEAVKLIPKIVSGAQIIKIKIPTVFERVEIVN